MRIADNARRFSVLPARLFVVILAVCAVFNAFAQGSEPVTLQNERYVVTIAPASLEVTFQERGKKQVTLSAAQTGLAQAADLKASGTTVSWDFPDLKLRVNMALGDEGLAVHFLSEKTGDITFPIIREGDATKGWILPMFEGVYAPRGDEKWASFLTKQEGMSTTAELTMPFIGMDYGDFTMTCLLTNAFNNTLQFEKLPDRDLQARLTHQFTRNHPVKECGYLFVIGTNSPVEPARIYRRWLMKRGEFVSMTEKIKKTPDAAKLAGAAQIYLWGGDLIAPGDILNWKQLVQDLKAQGEAEAPSPGKRIWTLMTPEARKSVDELAKSQWPDRYNERQVTEDLSRILKGKDFYEKSFWPRELQKQELKDVLKRDRSEWSQAQTCRVNCELLAEAFPGLVAKPEDWGEGICPKMVKEFVKAGFDRLWLGSGSWDEFEQRPETIEAAKKAGYLIGPYDSYNSIHRPDASVTWETAQFDEKLYVTGAIVNANGSKRAGFKKKGYVLNPITARPYVEKRVDGLMKEFVANSWFMDCDGFGDYYDDYSELHPMTQQGDMQARIDRMAWIRDKFGAVVGSEGCSAGVAATIFFAHGVMTPVIGWGDPDLTDKKSKYYLGKYYPPEQPEVFFKSVPAKEEYRYIYFEPRFRLPLFETVFHDSVVATHHWSEGSLKTKDQVGTVELLELLYNVPPLYHLNLAEFQKRKEQIKRHYDLFSPLHRVTATLPMTDFKWLTEDRAVQQTEFGGSVEMIANFGTTDYRHGDVTVPKRSVVARWRKTGETKIYSLPENSD
jgi:hypothetical protein